MWRNVLFGGNVGYRARLGRRKKRRLAATGAALAAITASVITGVPAASAGSSETVIVTASGLLSPVTAVLQVGGSVQTQFHLINGVLASIPTAEAAVLDALSPRQFQECGLLSQVAAALDASGLPSELLIFEITETMVMEDLAGAREVMKRLNRLGVRLAIDDFGTGHSSLAYLKQFPVHEVKVDRVFVQGIAESTVDSAIVRAVIDLANAMDIATVAEGVETRDQVAELRRLGCDVAQGYYFSPPLRAREFDAELARHFAPATAPSAPAISLPPGAARPAQLDAHHHQGRGQHQPRREDEQVATGHGTAPEFSERSLPIRAVSQPAGDAISVKCAWWRCGGRPSGRRG